MGVSTLKHWIHQIQRLNRSWKILLLNLTDKTDSPISCLSFHPSDNRMLKPYNILKLFVYNCVRRLGVIWCGLHFRNWPPFSLFSLDPVITEETVGGKREVCWARSWLTSHGARSLSKRRLVAREYLKKEFRKLSFPGNAASWERVFLK